jgi:general secretion pathway protein C
MMKRLPLLVSFVLFLALCASLAYWALQLFAPAPRPVAAPPQAERKMPLISAAENLFGGHSSSGTMANMQLRGVIHAGKAADSEVILVANNEPPKYVKVDAEISEGVTLKEIHPRYVVLDDHGVSREVNLPEFMPTPLSAQSTKMNPPNQQPANPSATSGEPPAPNAGTNASGGGAAEEQSSSAKGIRQPQHQPQPQPSTARSATDLR